MSGTYQKHREMPGHFNLLICLEAPLRPGLTLGVAVIADICRDLGIAPGHLDRAFCDELAHAIVSYGGSLAGYFNTMNRRLLGSWSDDGADPAEPGWPAAPPRSPAPATSPP